MAIANDIIWIWKLLQFGTASHEQTILSIQCKHARSQEKEEGRKQKKNRKQKNVHSPLFFLYSSSGHLE
jgi:hypothetical protein